MTSNISSLRIWKNSRKRAAEIVRGIFGGDSIHCSLEQVKVTFFVIFCTLLPIDLKLSYMQNKRLSLSYSEFFLRRIGPILLFVHLAVLLIFFRSWHKEIVLILIISLTSIFFMSMISFLDYSKLKKNFSIKQLSLDADKLTIDSVSYAADQIRSITPLSAQNILDKYNIYLIEILTVDGQRYLVFDRDVAWKLESATIKSLREITAFNPKIMERKYIDGIVALKSQV